MIITKEELNNLIENGSKPLVIDVCETYEHARYKIDGAVNIPLGLLPVVFDERFPKLEKHEKIVVYCAHGVRSRFATKFLQDKGFESVYSLKGGIAEYLGLNI